MGRPTTHIDGARLRELREEAGFTQLELAEKVYLRAGKAVNDGRVMKTSAGRWEQLGRVQPHLVKHLAEELKTTIAILQGEPPEPAPSRIDNIESQLNNQLIAKVPSSRFVEALENYREDDNPTRELAICISRRLEAAQLSQAQEEFEDIAAITGYSLRELQQPTSFEGFWMLICTGPPGPDKTEILSGVTSVTHVVRNELQTCLESWNESDSHVIFLKEKHWYRVTISHQRNVHLTRTLRFIRCQPRETGLQWSSPTWEDRYFVESLLNDAYNFANFVTGFDAVPVPADCRNLRFAITKRPSRQNIERLGLDAKAEIVELTAGTLAELPEERLEAFRQEGESHDLVVNRLASDLWEKLQPFMADWPMECWSFGLADSRIQIRLDVPLKLYVTSKAQPDFGTMFNVRLVELHPEGGQRLAPWRKKSVAIVHERLTKSLLEARQVQMQSRPQLPAT